MLDYEPAEEGGKHLSPTEDSDRSLLCSACFRNEGLRLIAEAMGELSEGACPNCSKVDGAKLNQSRLGQVAHSFFVKGTVAKCSFGGAPRVQFNEHQKTSVRFDLDLTEDAELISSALGIGFFEYGPRLWMVGEIEPLRRLENAETRGKVLQRIVAEYPSRLLSDFDKLYRVRVNPEKPGEPASYDAPPTEFSREGRLNRPGVPVLYASPDIQVCLHECRITAEDDIFVATLSSSNQLKLLDLCAVLHEDVTEFESLDLAVYMAFLAGTHAYQITQSIADTAKRSGFDGVIYPSYFSSLRTGYLPFETSYGLSHRRVPSLAEYERAKIVDNVAIFGRPIAEDRLSVTSINRFVLSQAIYGGHFGPADFW